VRPGDPPFFETTYLYDTTGRHIRETLPDGRFTQWVYDDVAKAGYPGGDLPLVVETLRDAAHNLTRITHPDGTAFTYIPDALDRVDAILDGAGTTTLVDFVYDPLRLLTQQVFGAPGSPRAAMQIDYDLAGRVDEIRHLGTGGTSLAVLDYLLDPTGAVDQIDDLSGAPVGSVLDYGYDLTKQLTSVVYPAGHPADAEDTTWQYDAAGNRELETIGADPALDYVPNALNQYASVGGTIRSHDLNGNLTGDGTRTLGWDAESQMTSASLGGTTASYAYDPFGRRVRKTVGGTDTWFLWSGDRLLEERDDTGAAWRNEMSLGGPLPPRGGRARPAGAGGRAARDYAEERKTFRNPAGCDLKCHVSRVTLAGAIA
jgi:YD repeat-containing protein